MEKLKLDKMDLESLLYFRDSHMSLIHKWQRMIEDIDGEIARRKIKDKPSK